MYMLQGAVALQRRASTYKAEEGEGDRTTRSRRRARARVGRVEAEGDEARRSEVEPMRRGRGGRVGEVVGATLAAAHRLAAHALLCRTTTSRGQFRLARAAPKARKRERERDALSPMAGKWVRGVCLTVMPLDARYSSRRDMRGPEVEILGLGAASAGLSDVDASPSTSMAAGDAKRIVSECYGARQEREASGRECDERAQVISPDRCR